VNVCDLPGEPSEFGCMHAVRLEGLTASTRYSFRVVSADASVTRVVRSDVIPLQTLEPQPRLVLNELFASPRSGTGLASADEGKFVELYNSGTVPANPAGWKLGRCAEPECTSPLQWTWTLAAPASGASIAPGGYAVAGGASFNATVMGVPGSAVVVRGSSSTMSGLTKSTAYTYCIVNPAGAVVSTYARWLGEPGGRNNDGHSFERKDPAGNDESDNWALSVAGVAAAAGNFATPGAPNSVH